MTDESVLEWAKGWVSPSSDKDPTWRERFLDGLLSELQARRSEERVRIVAWLRGEDARRYTEVGPLVAQAILEGKHVPAEVVADSPKPLRPRTEETTERRGR